jgi:hypothetical protein
MNGHVLTYRQELSDALTAEREGILEALRCVVGSEGAVYMATPITGGLRFLKWYEAEGRHLSGRQYDTQWRTKVVAQNCEDAAAFAETLRGTLGKVVIDPSRFFLDHWTQPAYRALWCEVVRRFANAVHLNEGWWASVGCAHEFLAAVDEGIPLFEGLGDSLSPEAGLHRLQVGVERLQEIGAPRNDLVAVLGDLERLLRKGSS